MSTITIIAESYPPDNDPRIKVVERFLSDVLCIGSEQVHSLKITASFGSIEDQIMPIIEKNWEITAVLYSSHLGRKMTFRVNRITDGNLVYFAIESVGFVPRWKP